MGNKVFCKKEYLNPVGCYCSFLEAVRLKQAVPRLLFEEARSVTMVLTAATLYLNGECGSCTGCAEDN